MKTLRSAILFALAVPLACSDGEPLSPAVMIEEMPEERPPAPLDPVTEARALFPRAIDLHSGVIARTCSPNPGVCHHTSNYPDLHTMGNVLALLRAPCNLEIPNPEQGWDRCERKGDRLRAESWVTELAWIEQVSEGDWKVGLREAAPVSARERVALFTADDELVLDPPPEWFVGLDMTAGSKEARLTVGAMDPFLFDFVDTVLLTAIGGDANRNGVFGADDAAQSGAVVAPGSLGASYLWGRITGTVPGSRMPLANQALSNAEYVAIACWIEGLNPDAPQDARAAIDYDTCNFAKNPIAYAPQ
jgi:hypothetical protein